MKQVRQYIRGLIKEMAYIDDYPPGHAAYEKGGSLQDPSVAKTYTGNAERLKKKRSKPPGTWMKVINVLLAGGYISEPYPSTSKSYILYDVQDELAGTIREKTFQELADAGFLTGEEWPREGFYILSDEGRGYLK
jgi:hypothetical protein